MADKDSKATEDTGTIIRDGEHAVKLTSDIEGGLGNHKKGTVLRGLSLSAFTTLSQAGGHDVVKPGTKVGSDAVDLSA